MIMCAHPVRAIEELVKFNVFWTVFRLPLDLKPHISEETQRCTLLLNNNFHHDSFVYACWAWLFKFLWQSRFDNFLLAFVILVSLEPYILLFMAVLDRLCLITLKEVSEVLKIFGFSKLTVCMSFYLT
jgi:hypothetical protein